jgi:hypothetical protein
MNMIFTHTISFAVMIAMLLAQTTKAVYSMIESEEYMGCIELKNENTDTGAKLVLGDCSSGYGWELDNNGLIHSEKDPTKCMQVGHDGAPHALKYIRMYPCDQNKPLQLFGYDHDGMLHLLDDDDFCITFHGIIAHTGMDSIIMNRCNLVGGRAQWNFI